jgi:hypothetical protein
MLKRVPYNMLWARQHLFVLLTETSHATVTTYKKSKYKSSTISQLKAF